jgi:expansin (peptidoglycan-binding protein)
MDWLSQQNTGPTNNQAGANTKQNPFNANSPYDFPINNSTDGLEATTEQPTADETKNNSNPFDDSGRPLQEIFSQLMRLLQSFMGKGDRPGATDSNEGLDGGTAPRIPKAAETAGSDAAPANPDTGLPADSQAAPADSDTDASADAKEAPADSDAGAPADSNAAPADSDIDAPADAKEAPADSGQKDDNAGKASDSPIHKGEATFYGATGEGALGFDATDDRMLTAMNTIDLYGLDAAGGYVKVKGPKGEVTVKVVDELPEQRKGALDLSQEAFAMIADPVDGRVPIEWQFVEGDVEGPIQYKFKEGSNEYWTAIQIRNHRTRVKKVEVQKADGSWEALNRERYNYFTSPSGGMGSGPYNIRVTDVNGQVIEDKNVSFSPGSVVDGKSQFPSTENT